MESSYDDFVTAALQFLADRPGSQVLIICEGAKGFETYRTGNGLAWVFGALKVAKITLKRMMDDNYDSDLARQRSNEEEVKIQTAIDAGKRKAN